MPRRGRAVTQQRDYAERHTEEKNAIARESARIGMFEHRARQSQEAHEDCNEQKRLRRRQVRAQEIHEAREQRLAAQRQSQQQHRLPPWNIEFATFRYEPDIE
ncbi:uncharacterized protein LOC105665442 [Ceratitis capitata]|uniref:uncharacterized protein LOC105665442 n=1 Tax=Ceratitis capitata TaxID=7213 RepID=UPI00061892B5|nr:uncharacterized protein LOC105665442 [Ceratitis capitata]